MPTEVWDPIARTATVVGTDGIGRKGHTATLLGDGRVLVSGGTTLDGMPATEAVVIDPVSGTRQGMRAPEPERQLVTVAASIPAPGAMDVALDAHLAVRFSAPLALSSLTPETLRLSGPTGAIATRVIAAEDGRLAFVWPAELLAEHAEYTLAVSGAIDLSGVPVAPASITFTTVQAAKDHGDVVDNEEWVPDAESIRNGWRTNRPPSPWESLAPLTAPPGVTAISGRVLTLDGRPLPDVTLEEGSATTQTDRTGRFLLVLNTSAAGRRVLNMEGQTASRPDRQYGFFEYGLSVESAQTNVLPFTIWMPKLDTRHVVTIPSPTTAEVVVTTPSIPGLELHLPPQTVISGEDGTLVTQVGITAVPVDRPPFPLAKNVQVPVYFTVQPGSSYVYTAGSGPKGAWLVYPNYGQKGLPGQRVQFFHYDPDVKDWYVYGAGTVTANGAQVVPDPTTRLYEFTGAMINVPWVAPFLKWLTGGGQPAGDPMDPSTGLFSAQKTDLYLPDVIPLALTRTYMSGDGQARPFGYGMMHAYAMFLWSANQYQEADLVLPEGTMIHYVRTSAGTGWTDAVFEHTATPTAFYKSTIAWNGNGWNLTRKDGSVYVFGENAPLQAIKDRYGNTVTITHANGQTGNIARVTSPNGRYIALTYDTSDRITQASDNIGRTVGYTYDTNGNLSTVTDPESNVTTYTYDTSHQMLTIRDGRNIVYLTNQYDTNGRVSQQTLADPNATYQYSYTVSSGSVTQTDITDPRGHVERLAFNSDHYVTSDTQAYGTSLARTTATTRQSGSNLPLAVVDGLSRRTEYTYDASGHVLTQRRLAGTSDAVTTTLTYEAVFGQVATITDPLNHTWTVGYDSVGKPTSLTDPLSHQTTMAINSAGQITSVTDPLSHTWQSEYTNGDLTSMTNPVNAIHTQFTDAAGRVIAATDPLGRVTRTTFNKLNRPTAVIDPAGGQTSFSYNEDSNLLSLTDALNHPTTYTYDASNRVATRTDPLQQPAAYAYDKNGNLTQLTDRKDQVTSYQYDVLDRLTLVTYSDSSTTLYVYDAGDRQMQIIDSLGGTITRAYDLLDQLTSETTPEGSITYTYDNDGRRATMTIAGQATITYGYDDAHHLASMAQGMNVVSLGYDNAGRRNTLSLPSGIVTTYGYDNANRLTTLTYTLGPATLGGIAYAYDAAGRRVNVVGAWARTALPQSLASATYDAANRLMTWAGQAFSYDANGNLSTDGVTSYLWNARNELVGLGGATTASFGYDGVGRRNAKTVVGTTTFLYDGPNVVQELVGGSPSANLLVGGVDEVFQRTDSGGAYSVLADVLGSTLALSDGSGTIQTQYTYEPFGAATVSGVTSVNPTQFTGRENDETGLFSYRARYYNPNLQRFVSEDPLGFIGGDANLYAYVGNSPTNYTDPFGLFFLTFCTDLGTLTLYDDGGDSLATYPAANNAQSSSAGPWPPGVYPYERHTVHSDDGPDSQFGSNGNYIFTVPGRSDMGIHSGRRDTPDKLKRKGPGHATDGCIRTTDEGTDDIKDLQKKDPLRKIIVGPCGG
jgi:RHS repeat-associated protein